MKTHLTVKVVFHQDITPSLVKEETQNILVGLNRLGFDLNDISTVLVNWVVQLSFKHVC